MHLKALKGMEVQEAVIFSKNEVRTRRSFEKGPLNFQGPWQFARVKYIKLRFKTPRRELELELILAYLKQKPMR